MNEAKHLPQIKLDATRCKEEALRKLRMPQPSEDLQKAVAKIEKKMKARVAVSPLEKLLVYQYLSRVWRRHLTVQELSVAFYVLDRSVGWGTSFFVASSANVLHGTDDYSGVGLPDRTYFRTLKSMEDVGLLFRKRTHDRTLVGLDLGFAPWK